MIAESVKRTDQVKTVAEESYLGVDEVLKQGRRFVEGLEVGRGNAEEILGNEGKVWRR